MVNVIWACMAMVGLVYAMIHGTIDDVNEAIFKSASDAVTLSIGLISVLVFWLGIMRIAKEAGILDVISIIFRPIILKLFPDIPKDDPVIGYILSNVIANFFGLGNAATPMGIKAMEEMKRLSGTNTASRSMITFLALNTSGLTLIPTTVIAIRMQFDSISPTEIVGTTIVATVASTISAIFIDRLFYNMEKKKHKK